MEKSTKDKALEIAQLIEDGKATDVVVIDVSKLNSWTDYFVISTITSSAHWQGLYKQVKEDIIPCLESNLHLDFTGKILNSLNDWVSIENDTAADVDFTIILGKDFDGRYVRASRNN